MAGRKIDIGVIARAAAATTLAAFVLRAPVKTWPWDLGLFAPWKEVSLWTWIVAALVGVIVGWQGDRLAKWARIAPRWRIDLLLAIVTILIVRRTSYAAFHNFPQIADEIAYDLLGRRISVGHPIPAAHPLADFFRIRFMVDDGGRDYPLFQPGWPLVIAVGYKLHLQKSIPAIATAALVVAGSRLADRLYGRMTAIVAGVILLSSGFVGWVGASYFAHAWAAALFAFSIERGVAALEENAGKKAVSRAIVGGLAAAWLCLTRLPIALALLLPLVVVLASYAFERVKGKPFVRLRASARRPIAAFALASMIGPLGQIGWDLATTGRAFELPQDRYFALTESNPDCHRLGFGDDVGCHREHPGEVPPEGFGPARAMEVDRMRWEVFRTDAWGCAVPLVIFGLFAARKWKKRDAVVASAIAAPVIVSTFFYYHAIQHGTRLWAESMPPLGVALASAVALPFEEREAFTVLRSVWRVASGVAMAVLVVAGVSEVFVRNPDRAKENSRDLQPERVAKNLDRGGVHHAVVYLANCIDVDRGDMVLGWASVLNGVPPDSGDRIFARDFGDEMDRQLVAMFPDRRHVRATCDGAPLSFPNAVASPRWIVSELEAKFPTHHRDAYAFLATNDMASQHVVLRLRTNGGGEVAFQQYVFEDGVYDVAVQIVRRLDGGRLVLSIDGTPIDPPILGAGPDAVIRWMASTPRPLTKGEHVFRFASPDGPGTRVIDLDRIDLRER